VFGRTKEKTQTPTKRKILSRVTSWNHSNELIVRKEKKARKNERDW
jgi:hypothetical protein